MMQKIKQFGHLYTFFCPGCRYGHNVTLNGVNGWQWNLSMSKPTLRPSLLVNKDRAGNLPRCHSMITSGMIQFLEDSTHALAGKTVELPDWPEVEENLQKEIAAGSKAPMLGSGEPSV